MKPPYYAVIFTSIKTENLEGYSEMTEHMITLAKQQNGFLGLETAQSDIGITVSYWESLDVMKVWKQNAEHLIAQQNGKSQWYKSYRVRICKVERDYEFSKF